MRHSIRERDLLYLNRGSSGGSDIPVVAPTGTLEITENGTHDVTNYASAEVNVASSGGGSSDLDAYIEGSLTEIRSNVDKISSYTFQGKDLLVAHFPLVTEINDYAFKSCSKLATLYFPSLTYIGGYAFQSCKALTNVELQNVTTIKQDAFNMCSNLTMVNLPNVTSIGERAFTDCKKLKTIFMPNVTSIGSVSLRYSALIELDLPKATSIGQVALANCTSLTTLILRSNTLCTASSDPLVGTPIASGKGYIYVPSALIEQYKVATNWTIYATQFRALEDYTVDGTITGELDETKI